MVLDTPFTGPRDSVASRTFFPTRSGGNSGLLAGSDCDIVCVLDILPLNRSGYAARNIQQQPVLSENHNHLNASLRAKNSELSRLIMLLVSDHRLEGESSK